MKKTIWVKVLTMAMVVVLAAGAATVPVRAKSKGYQFKYGKVTVSMGGAAKNLIKKAGKPIARKVKKSCAYAGKDRTYKYKDFILYTYSNSDKGAEYVNSIVFRTKKASTREGIHIGSPYSDVKKKYGRGKDNFGIYTYKKGSSKLQIEVTDDVVTNIRYIKAK